MTTTGQIIRGTTETSPGKLHRSLDAELYERVDLDEYIRPLFEASGQWMPIAQAIYEAVR